MNSHYVLLGCVIRKADQGSQDDDFSYFHFFLSLLAISECVCVCVCEREQQNTKVSLVAPAKRKVQPSLTLSSLISLPDEILGKRRVCSPNSSSECPLESKKARSESPKGKCCSPSPIPFPFLLLSPEWNLIEIKEGGLWGGSCVWHWGCRRRRAGLCFSFISSEGALQGGRGIAS